MQVAPLHLPSSCVTWATKGVHDSAAAGGWTGARGRTAGSSRREAGEVIFTRPCTFSTFITWVLTQETYLGCDGAQLTPAPWSRQLVRKIQPINDMSLLFATVSDDPRMKGPLSPGL